MNHASSAPIMVTIHCYTATSRRFLCSLPMMRSAICDAVGAGADGVTGRPISSSARIRTAAPIFIAGRRPSRIALRTVETEIERAFAYCATETYAAVADACSDGSFASSERISSRTSWRSTSTTAIAWFFGYMSASLRDGDDLQLQRLHCGHVRSSRQRRAQHGDCEVEQLIGRHTAQRPDHRRDWARGSGRRE